MSDLISGSTTCRICRQSFSIGGALVVGKGLDQVPEKERALVMLMWKLRDHLVAAHKDVNRILETRAAEYLGLLRTLEFATTEKKLAEQVDLLRWSIHQSTIAVRLTDEKIASESRVFAEQLAAKILGIIEPGAANHPGVTEGAGALRPKIAWEIERAVAALVTNYRNLVEEPNKWVTNQAAPAATAAAQKVG
jgi:hypothetical protein